MKNLKLFSLLLFTLAGFTSCGLDDDQTDCITGPVGFNVEFVDAESGENLYRNDTFQSAQLKITDEDDKQVAYRFITELDKTFIQVNLGFETGDKVVTMQLDDVTAVEFELTLSMLQESCKTYYISDLEVPEYGYTSDATGIIRVSL